MSAELIGKFTRVDLVYIGEGYNGNYDPENPADEKLLRFDVYYKDNDYWIPANDSSYCTTVPTDTPQETQNKIVEYIYNEVDEILSCGSSIKKLCEKLSWISPEWVEN